MWYSATMRLLYIADGRSPTTLSWLQHWTESGHETHLISTFPCEAPPGLKTFHILPVAFSGMMKAPTGTQTRWKTISGKPRQLINLIRPLRNFAGPLSLPFYQNRYCTLVEDIHPDLVHALRIPFEGMLASNTPKGIPLVVSIWGNDITLHAHGSIIMGRLTRRTLRRADGLIADANRDIRLGKEWGFASNQPTLVVPGAGGMRSNENDKLIEPGNLPEELPDALIVVNPRGQRPGSLRQDVFFRAIPLVLEKVPKVVFICPNLAGDSKAEHWVESLGIGANTKLWPHLEKAQMRQLYKAAGIFVSPSIHDGMPNSLLEAMFSGCFPIVGNIESMQEWIKPGVNGLLVDANSPSDLANGIITALKNPALCASAKKENAQIIAERANYERCMAKTEAFYVQIENVVLKKNPV